MGLDDEAVYFSFNMKMDYFGQKIIKGVGSI